MRSVFSSQCSVFSKSNAARLAWIALIGLGVILLGTGMALAQGGGDGTTPPVREVTADEVNAISNKLYCPVCENIPLDVCGTEACARWRAQVRTLLEGGASEDEVIAYFVNQFGERVVGTPQDPTLNFLSWSVPVAGVVLGLVAVGVIFIRWRGQRGPVRRTAELAEDEATLDADYRARLERELRLFK